MLLEIAKTKVRRKREGGACGSEVEKKKESQGQTGGSMGNKRGEGRKVKWNNTRRKGMTAVRLAKESEWRPKIVGL